MACPLLLNHRPMVVKWPIVERVTSPNQTSLGIFKRDVQSVDFFVSYFIKSQILLKECDATEGITIYYKSKISDLRGMCLSVRCRQKRFLESYTLSLHDRFFARAVILGKF